MIVMIMRLIMIAISEPTVLDSLRLSGKHYSTTHDLAMSQAASHQF